MSPENAKTLTVKLADRLTLPQTADAPAPVAPAAPAPAAATPGQTASAAPATPQKQP
jgi:hypothetical protein